MKTRKSFKNSVWAMISNTFSILVGLVAQSLFLKILSVEYLGINGLFSNIISMLGIVELGIGNAIIYNLYKPLVKEDHKTIKKLLNFYKKSYRLIGIIVFCLGMIILPFLNIFIGKVNININIKIIYILFILDITFSYFLSYKRSLLYADQKNYIINIIHIIYLVLMNSSQLLVLYFTKNYYLYLIIKIIFRILENVIISIIVNKQYEYINDNNNEELDEEIKNDIFTKIKALFFHKIGSFVVNGTDNLVISKYLGVVTVGLYSNYYLIINSVQTLFGQVLAGTTASVGHLLVENNPQKSYNVFKNLRFINFWIATFAGVSIFIIMNPFITLWIGQKYLLPIETLLILTFNFYLKMMTNCYSIYKETAGIFKEDRFVPIIESIINIIFSIILVKQIGLSGVFIGTIISSLCYWLYSYPKFIYKGLFKKDYFDYIKENIGYLLLFSLILIISTLISIILKQNNIISTFIINILISVFVPNVIIFVLFIKDEKLKFIFSTLKKILKRGEKYEN